jgi:hypothetical protein
MPKYGVCGTMGIRLMGDCEISVYKSVLRALGNPKNLHFWWNDRDKLLYVTGAMESTPLSIPVSDSYYRNRSGLKFRNVGLYRSIQNRFGQHDAGGIDLVGRAFPLQRMAVFQPHQTAKEAKFYE